MALTVIDAANIEIFVSGFTEHADSSIRYTFKLAQDAHYV